MASEFQFATEGSWNSEQFVLLAGAVFSVIELDQRQSYNSNVSLVFRTELEARTIVLAEVQHNRANNPVLESKSSIVIV